jgi:predicted N-acetyltransferase YhbS
MTKWSVCGITAGCRLLAFIGSRVANAADTEEEPMNSAVRHYSGPDDFKRVGDFLIEHYQPANADGNWLQPTWEYMHSHPNLDEASLGKIGIWEAAGRIVGVAHYESSLGEAFFEVHPDYTDLKPDMLDYAEAHLVASSADGGRSLQAFINDFDQEFEALVRARGYRKDEACARPMAQFLIPHPFPPIDLPAGFQLKSLAEDNDLAKINRVLWRGFDHPGEPPASGIAGREKMQSGPNFRKDLTIVVVAPDGQFVAFCGMWHEAANQIAYVEPVATDPDFRRMGLGKAAVLEGIRRCGALGATVAFVASEQPFYLALGFRKLYTSNCWVSER